MGFVPGTSLVIRHASVPGNAFSVANQPGDAYGSGAVVVVGATVETSEDGVVVIMVVVVDSALPSIESPLESLLESLLHAVIAKALTTKSEPRNRENLMLISTIGAEQ
jgi:hypothetical protein